MLREELKMDLQLFAEDEDEIEEEDFEIEEEDYEEDDDVAEDAPLSEKEENMLSQEQVNEIVQKRIAREMRKNDDRLKKIFGTSDLDLAANYYKAGYTVAQRAGLKPQDVVSRLSGQGNQQNPNATMSNDNQLMQELQQIKDVIYSQETEKVKSNQAKEAKKEFGRLYDQYEADIEEVAEDRGLTLVDAAAIVLRPHLPKLYESREKKKKKMSRNRRVESTDGSPSKNVDLAAALTPEMKRVAKKQGLSLKEYYKIAKDTGLITD